MNTELILSHIMEQFNVSAPLANYGNGHINDTYLSNPKQYLLQRINTNIFTDPESLMENIEHVTDFLRDKITAHGGNPDRETMTIIKTKNGKNYYTEEGQTFRMYKYVDNTISIEVAETPTDLYNAGRGFGKFQALLDDFPADTLHEIIADFHNTPKRLEALEAAIVADKAGRAASVTEEIAFVRARAEMARIVVTEMEHGTIPVRVTHNDTKINNILFDAKTREAVCVIDLDTVMPGSALYDFGDALRIGASTAAEDETDLSLVHFSIPHFEAFAKGYLEETGALLTKKEISLLAHSAKLLTFECGARFLTDYLNGDTYFKVHREHHNLDRARNQFRLVEDIEAKEDEMNRIVASLI